MKSKSVNDELDDNEDDEVMSMDVSMLTGCAGATRPLDDDEVVAIGGDMILFFFWFLMVSVNE